MTSTKKYVGMDVHKESISIAVMNSVGKMVMECVLETKASMILTLIVWKKEVRFDPSYLKSQAA
jgi:hypothetical protein